MNNIPPKLRTELAQDPYYKTCCLRHLVGCSGQIEWHHVLTWKGRQLQKRFAIVPACRQHHRQAAELKEYFEQVALNRATDEELKEISKAIDYIKLRDRLNQEYLV